MHDSDSGIGTDSGMIPFLAGIGIKDFLLESESEPESEILKMLESESEPESRHARNRASLPRITLK